MDLLLIIRGLAALAVVVWHAEGYHGQFPAMINVPGRTAVWLFFGISGYVISYGFIHKRYSLTLSDLKWFYMNRLLRIYPLFLALSVLAWITELVTTGSSPIGLKDVPAQLFALQFNQDYVLNGVFWTLGIEIQFYLLAPLLVMPLLVNNGVRTYALVFALYIALVYWNRYAVGQFGWSYDGRNIVSNLPHFFIGMIACQLVSTFKPSRVRLTLSIVGAVTLLAFTSWLYHRSPGQFWSVRGILLVDFLILFLVFAHASCDPRSLRKHPLYVSFALLGTLSYGIYAWHSYLMKYVPYLEAHVVVLIVVTTIMAYVSYRLVERPALKLKRHRPLNVRQHANTAIRDSFG